MVFLCLLCANESPNGYEFQIHLTEHFNNSDLDIKVEPTPINVERTLIDYKCDPLLVTDAKDNILVPEKDGQISIDTIKSLPNADTDDEAVRPADTIAQHVGCSSENVSDEFGIRKSGRLSTLHKATHFSVTYSSQLLCVRFMPAKVSVNHQARRTSSRNSWHRKTS